MPLDPIARIRRFNRAVTAATGALDDCFLGRGRPLGAARLLWSVADDGSDVAVLRETLGLDSGLLSRLLRGLESEGLVTTEADPADRRRRIARLTPGGRAEKAAYDRLNDEMAQGILARAGRRPEELLAAMDLVATTLLSDRIAIAPADPEDPDARACLRAYAALLSDRIPGIPAAHVPCPDPEADHYRSPGGAFLLARSDGLALGCVSVKTVDPGLGEVKRLWVAPSARGQGLARRLMAEIEDRSRALGLMRLRLDTNAHLPEAIALYRATGWEEVTAFTPFPATHWFAKDL